ncbi:MAG TPA: formyltransferase [Deltaproteobacteria bacterium]|nr:formyltransferase [Deltaproteobacteria bacterium]
MKAVVFAYHNMGVIGIEKLLAHGFKVPMVFTHEDSASENIWFGSVRDLCKDKGITAVTPLDPNTEEWIGRIRPLKPDFIFSFYYRHMLSADILSIPRLGAYNLHGSLLPRYRGRCPVNWAIIKGETLTGVTLHEMVEKPDAGAVVAQAAVPIDMTDTALTLFHKLEQAAGDLLDDCLPVMRGGRFQKTPQDLSQGSYFGGRKPEDGKIDWHDKAIDVYNLIRGVTRPYPGAFGNLSGRQVIIWRAALSGESTSQPGLITIRGQNVLIGCGHGSIAPLEIEVDAQVMRGKDLFDFFKIHSGEVMR